MLAISGDASRLRPHIKTHKMKEIVRMQMDAGILKFKCATLAELRMLVECGAEEVLLARQPVKPDTARLVRIAKENPDTRVATIIDNFHSLRAIESECQQFNKSIGAFLDINVGADQDIVRIETAMNNGSHHMNLYFSFSDLPEQNVLFFLELIGLDALHGQSE